ncbi:MAG: hypothetical protein ABIA77_05785 [Candidatus Omnitrophota bacterium]
MTLWSYRRSGGEGVIELKDRIVQFLQKDMEDMEVLMPHGCYGLIEAMREKGAVKSEEYREDGILIRARIPRKLKYSILKKLKTGHPELS